MRALVGELVGVISLSARREIVFVELISLLQKLGLHINGVDGSVFQIAVRCLTRASKPLFWSQWSDKLVFDVTSARSGFTTVNVYAIPNLLRIHPAIDEEIADVHQIVAVVGSLLSK